MTKILSKTEVSERVSEILNDNIKAYEHDNICLLDIVCDIQDTEDLEVVTALKNHIVTMLDDAIMYRLLHCRS